LTLDKKLSDSESITGRTLTFAFPFYGHPIKHVTMLTSGLISLASIRHANLHENQYIAPLMADFIQDDQANMLSDDNGQTATFTWENVKLRNSAQIRFTFQASLHANGNIEFVYKNVPKKPTLMDDYTRPVTVGLADAIHIERRSGHLVQEQLITYHNVSLTKELSAILDHQYSNRQNHGEVLIEFKALKTCNQFKTCWQCLTHGTDFNCVWCPGLKTCSDDGLDRNYQVLSCI
jgi:hypothetical protein